MSEANKAIVEQMWAALYRKDWERLATYFTEDAFYEDVPTPDTGARGAANIVRRLRMGLDAIVRFEHHVHRVVAEGESVIVEHTEVWHFHTGEVLRNRFVTVHEIERGKIKLWRDYWDLNTMMSQAPKWWIESLAKHAASEFGAA